MDDPFAMLGLPRGFDLDPSEVDRAYLERAGAVHPDVAAGDDDAARKAAALNHAKRVLEDPERRARALLALLGGPGKEDRSLPPGFLMEIMETREHIEAARGPEERARWEAWAAERRREYQANVAGLFLRYAETGVPARVRMTLNAWRYIERLIEQLDPDYDPARADFD
ncbi:MAG: DnaJ domain-containing protein [Phycisphaerales bacterium]|nr:DnaJ domain-containing protein [Phycisphaerales bacterium]